jgi:hypothetical protein
VHEYGALYAQARVETMDALDALPYLANADELKSKLLYSVVVVRRFYMIRFSQAFFDIEMCSLIVLPTLHTKILARQARRADIKWSALHRLRVSSLQCNCRTVSRKYNYDDFYDDGFCFM